MTTDTDPAPTTTTSPSASASLLELLAAKTAALTWQDLTPHGERVVRTAFADTLGVALAGAGEVGPQLVRLTAVDPSAAGSSLVLGSRDRVGVLDAALLNAAAAHALDLDDGNLLIVGHPSAVLVPAVLALAEATDATCRQAAVAYAAGYEVMVRLARGVNTAHYQKGWHPTSTLGVLGAAAAGARLLDLDAERTATALAIAVSTAAGVKANFGTMVKALHIGFAARNGLLAARLAAAGFSANRAALEAPQGFLEVYNGAGSYDAAAVVADLDGSLEINQQINPIKRYACCGSTHSAVQAALQIRQEHALERDEIQRVDVVVDALRMPHTDRPHLQEALSGKFSLQYVVARALLDGAVRLEHFAGDAHLDPDVLALMAQVRVTPSPGPASNSFASQVSVTVQDGQVHRSFRDPSQDPAESYAHPPELWPKVADCAGRVLPPDQVRLLVEGLQAFPADRPVRDLMGLLEPATDAAADQAGTR